MCSSDLASPVAYAERYYLHYPKVAFGIWPPLFHFTAASWMLLFGASSASAMTFVSFVTALFALCIYLLGRKLLGSLTGAAAAVWFLLLPSVQASASMFMMDMLCATLMLLAACAFGRYLDTGRRRFSELFGLFAAAAVMTKYNDYPTAFVSILSRYIAFRMQTSTGTEDPAQYLYIPPLAAR